MKATLEQKEQELMEQINKANEMKEKLMDDLDTKSEAVRDLRNQHTDQESILREQIDALEAVKRSNEEDIASLKSAI